MKTAQRLACIALVVAGSFLCGAAVSSTGRAQEARSTPTAAATSTCGRPFAGAPMLVTGDCVDPKYTDPFIDLDEQRNTPVPHRYVHGGFKGTDAKFSLVFPLRDQYQRRFFQFTHQSFTENIPADDIAFAVASGAYLVQTNQGGSDADEAAAAFLTPRFDGSLVGYRANAAAAKYSRIIAAQMYGGHRPYGYISGSSGGGLQTKASMENTIGVWDGGVARVTGTPNSNPNKFAAWIYARVLLNDKFPSIIDAAEPGGGDMFAGLNEEQRTVLTEVTRYGFPPRAWVSYVPMGAGLVASYLPRVRILDPTYADDFWSKPGHLGTDPKSSLAKARVRNEATVVEVIAGPPLRVKLSSLPASPTGDLALTVPDMFLLSGAAQGQSVIVSDVDRATNSVGPARGADATVWSRIKAGDKVRIDNSWGLAVLTMYRHQLPERGSAHDYPIYDQWRARNGEPLYPQRAARVSPVFEEYASGGNQTGRFNGKLIYVQNLVDGHAFGWEADWYHREAEKAHGRRHLDENFRLWYIDHAPHGFTGDPTRLVSYRGVVEQALRDVSAWIEKGIAPPPSTAYRVVDGQVELPPTGAERRGVQPVVTLRANGGVRAEVKAGQPVTFTGRIEVPPNAGKVVAAEWDLLGAGKYTSAEQLAAPNAEVNVKATYTFEKPGTYFPALRATSQRQPDKTPHARIQNLDRVRVVVK